MPRLPQGFRDPLAEANSAVGGIAGAPLDCIAQALSNALETANGAISRGEMSHEELTGLAHYIQEIVRPLPKTYGDRFWFDAGLIRAMSNDWSSEKLFSTMIIPCYENQWGYSRVPMPLSEARSHSTPGRSHIIELVFLPGTDEIGQVALLQYPWIAHELAHSLMFRHDGTLIPLISSAVTGAVQKQRLAAIADRGRARAMSQEAMNQFSSAWMPTVDHRNWAHEIIADLVAMWVLGPSYLAAFEDLLGDGGQNPFQISTAHPPYAVRVAALLGAARRLRLAEYTQGLERISSAWGASQWCSEKTNRYRFLASAEVIDGLTDGAFGFCDQLRLRPWARSPTLNIDAASSDPSQYELGTDLLTVAWFVFSQRGQEGYRRWEAAVIRAIADSLRL